MKKYDKIVLAITTVMYLGIITFMITVTGYLFMNPPWMFRGIAIASVVVSIVAFLTLFLMEINRNEQKRFF